jgi:MFS family permease
VSAAAGTTRRPGVVVAACFTVMLSTVGSSSAFGVVIKAIEQDLGSGRAAIAAAYATSSLTMGVLALATGRWTDRYGPRRVVLWAGVPFAVGMLLTSAVQAPWQLFIGLGLLTGAGMSGTYIPVVTLATGFERRRSLYTGIAMAGAGVGGIVGPQVADAILQGSGWRTVYLAFGIFSAVAVQAAGRLLPADRPVRAAAPPATAPARPPAARDPRFLAFATIYAAQGLVMVGNNAHLQAHITDLGFTTGDAARTVGVLAAAGVAGSFALGVAADRFGAWAAFTGGSAVMLAGMAGLIFAAGLLPLAVVAVILGLATYGTLTAVPALAADLFGLGGLGAVLGRLELWWAVGAWLGPVYYGLTFDSSGHYTVAYATATAITAAALLLCPFLRGHPRRAAAAVVLPGHSSSPLASDGTSTACSCSAESGTTSSACSLVEASTTSDATPSS